MILSDADIIRAREYPYEPLQIEPWGEGALQGASIDLRLGDSWLIEHIDPKTGTCEWMEVDSKTYKDGKLWLMPNQFVIATTLERVTIPRWLAAQIGGKSTRGRQGVTVHQTAGFIDPGFSGQLTIELKNVSHGLIPLAVGDWIAQLVVMQLSSPAMRPYNGKYQGQEGPTAAR